MQHKIQSLTRGALIAAIYTLMCYLMAPLSYGAVQIRFSEALTLLPVLCPEAIWGVTLGCFLANMLTGSLIDMVLGTLTTMVAAFATYWLRNIRWKGLPLASALPPILLNGLVIGVMLTLLYTPEPQWWMYLLNMATVAAGQLVSCGLGVLLVAGIEKSPVLHRAFSKK